MACNTAVNTQWNKKEPVSVGGIWVDSSCAKSSTQGAVCRAPGSAECQCLSSRNLEHLNLSSPPPPRLLYYLFIQVKNLRGRATMRFKNRLVSRCSSNPSTHHEFLFVIRSCLDHRNDEVPTRLCMHMLLIRAILLQVLMQKTQSWRCSHNNINR